MLLQTSGTLQASTPSSSSSSTSARSTLRKREILSFRSCSSWSPVAVTLEDEEGRRRRQRQRSRGHLGPSGMSLCFVALLHVVLLQSTATTVSAAPVWTTVWDSFLPTSGPLDDAKCNIEDLEKANDSQLHVILQEIITTSFFKNFVVDLDQRCPLTSWRKKPSSDDKKDKKEESDPDAEEEEEDDDFDCPSKDEVDEGEQSSCSVSIGGDNPFLSSNALNSLSMQGQFESKSQKNAFAWKKQTDMVVVSENEPEQPCGEDEILPDSFWIDICSNIKAGDGTSKVVNLALNPEINTMYNGTHIWKAIYEENCILAPPSSSSSSLALQTLAGSSSSASGSDNNNNRDMCFEERVLYRLLSGLHTSTTLSIAMKYYPPSKKKNRPTWQPNPAYFMTKFQDHPEHLRNLHFSYVVLLRALQKASSYLYDYEILTGDIVEDEKATVLLTRLLDSAILNSCASVFSAFDESLMFQQQENQQEKQQPHQQSSSSSSTTTNSLLDVVSLQKNFKGVFHNISSILDCVQCQQCKLHGKMAMLGYGTALKILFMRDTKPQLERNEIVALINTIAKFSESLREVRELTHLFWQDQRDKITKLNEAAATPAIPATTDGGGTTTTTTSSGSGGATATAVAMEEHITGSIDLVDAAVGTVAALGNDGQIGWEQEAQLVELALQRNPELLILAKHYGTNSAKFLQLCQSLIMGSTNAAASSLPDAIVVGSGLAGLAATLNILDRGGSVILVEKEHLLGGNSNRASSGINACCPNIAKNSSDTQEVFRNDTTRSAGASARPDLIETLVSNSASAVTWLQERVGVDLSLTAQLGGHSSKRTHRPNNGMVGAEIIFGMQKAVKSYEKTGRFQLYTDTKVTKLLTNDGAGGTSVVGVEITKSTSGGDDDGADGSAAKEELRASNVILATGGFASDRSSGSYLEQYRPELVKMSTTAGDFSTGDGITLATALGAGTVDMDKVQVHPTGWVNPHDPNSTTKVLAGELLRGVGGLLLNSQGKRFCNELGTRAYVTKQMLSHDKQFAKTGQWNVQATVPTFSLVLSSTAAADCQKHVDLYTHKSLLTRVEGVTALAKWMGLSKSTVVATLKSYQKDAAQGTDEFGKTTFRGVPAADLEKEVFFAGTVTPVLHYCMGGITIDKQGSVLNQNGEHILGLHAAGEVTGGVHGVNRLAGNSLLECTVFGTIVGQKIPIQNKFTAAGGSNSSAQKSQGSSSSNKELSMRKVPMSELEEHGTPEDCWVAIHGVVYDLTDFAEEHPAGPASIHELAGKDGTEAFAAVHNEKVMEDFGDERMGVLDV